MGVMLSARRCRGCYQSMALASGCSVSRVVIMGATHQRVRWNRAAGGTCPDCGTIANGYHHVGCPAEECPVCGRSGRACRCGRLPVKGGPPLRADGKLADEPWEAELGNPQERVEGGA